jgi:hypothetical protein
MMKREQGPKPEKPGRPKRAQGNVRDEPRSGEGAASALASLKRIERDRDRSKPDDGSKR